MTSTENEAPPERRFNLRSIQTFWIPGAFYHPEQERQVKKIARRQNINLISETREAKANESIEDRVDLAEKTLSKLHHPIVIICHSLGTSIASRLIERLPSRVLGVVAFTGTTTPKIRLPAKTAAKTRRLGYIWPILFSRVFELNLEDEIFMRDGAMTYMGCESGKIIRQLKTGFPVRPIKEVLLPQRRQNLLMFVPKEDQVLSPEISREIGLYHADGIIQIEGGHFAHLHNHFAWEEIGETIRNWK